MQQKRVNNKLYVLDFTPYVITEDTDVDIIYVQQEKLDAYVELNPSLADKIKTINYLVYTVKKKEWADDEPSPSEKKSTEITFNSSYYGFNQGDTGNFADFIINPNDLDYTFSISDQTGNTLDPSDNDYITWDSKLNYTVQNQFGYNMNMLISRDEDSEWYAASDNKPTIIFPNSDEQEIQEQEIGSTFDEQSESLDIYLTPEILADMIEDDKTEDLIANILNYRYVLNATCSYDGNVRSTAFLYTQVDAESGVISIGDIFDEVFHPIFNITKEAFGGSEQTNSIALDEDVEWVTIHKPANSDFYAIYLDGLSNTRYVHTDFLYGYTNDNDLNYHQSFVNYQFGQHWKIYDSSDYSQNFLSSQYNTVEPDIDGGYSIQINPDNLPTNPFSIPCVEMVELTGSNHGGLIVNHPEGELWFIDLKNGTTSETFAWIDVDTLSDYVITTSHEVSVFKDGTHDLATDNHVTAVNGIDQSDIYDNTFMMPGNTVEVSAEFWQITEVDLQAEYGGSEVDHLVGAASFRPGTTDATLNVNRYVGYYEVDGVMESQEFGPEEVEWSCDVPEITFNLISAVYPYWCISCDSNYTPDGSETATVSLLPGDYAGSKEYTIIGEGS